MATIIVSNLHPKDDVSDLCITFKKFGRITSASLFTGNGAKPPCMGSVTFADDVSALAAVKVMNSNGGLKSKELKVRLATDDSETYCKIFVKNIPSHWDEIDLSEKFEDFGEVRVCDISRTDGKSNGYGFVTFKTHQSAVAAVKSTNNTILEGEHLIVEPFVTKGLRETLKHTSLEYAKKELDKSIQHNNLHIKNLPKDLEDQQLYSMFKPFGTIESWKIARFDDGSSKGFGYVSYQSEESARKALDRMNRFSINSKVLEVNYHQKKAARENYMQLVNSEHVHVKPVPVGTKRSIQKMACNPLGKTSEVIYSFHSKRY